MQGMPIVYCEKNQRVQSRLMPLNVLAWNNKIGPWYYFVGLRTEVMINRAVGGIRIPLSEVKFLDFWKTNYCESIYQGCFH